MRTKYKYKTIRNKRIRIYRGGWDGYDKSGNRKRIIDGRLRIWKNYLKNKKKNKSYKKNKVYVEQEKEKKIISNLGYYDVYINLDKVFLVDNKDSSRYIDSKENYFVMNKEPDIDKMKELIKSKYKILTKSKNDMGKNDFSDVEINAYENDGIKGETVYSSEEEVIDALFGGVKIHVYKGRKKGEKVKTKKLEIDIGPFGEKL